MDDNVQMRWYHRLMLSGGTLWIILIACFLMFGIEMAILSLSQDKIVVFEGECNTEIAKKDDGSYMILAHCAGVNDLRKGKTDETVVLSDKQMLMFLAMRDSDGIDPTISLQKTETEYLHDTKWEIVFKKQTDDE